MQIRYKQDVRKIGKAAGKAIKEADLPVKLFVVGPTEAGKTTIVRSIFNYLSKQELPRAHGFRSSTETVDSFWKTKHITADNLERTVGLVILRTRIAEDIFAIIYDLGGHETYYSLQAIFLHLENGFFLITIDVKQSEEHILEEVQKHLTVLSSKLPKGTTSEAVLAFTHFDLLEENKIGKKMLICKRARLNKFENIKIIGEVFIDAQDGDSKEFHKLMDLCKKMAQDVKSCMVRKICLCVLTILI